MSARLLVGCAPFLLAGCISLDPHYDRPKAPVSGQLPSGEAYTSLKGTRTNNYRDIDWQEYILDTRLQKVVAMALDSSRDLREAVASVKSARATYGEERSNLFPTINAELTGSRSRSLSGTGNQTAVSSSYEGNASTSSFELDLFGKNQSLTREQYETWLGTIEGARSTRLTVLYNTVDYWLTLAADKSNLTIAKETAESARQSLEVTQAQMRHGTASMVDVSSAATTYHSALADVAKYQTSVAQDKNALDLVVGQTVPDSLIPDSIDAVANAFKEIPAGISSDVLLNRPDVLEAEHNLKSANASIGAARANFFPSISLTASGGAASSDLSSLFKHGAGVWSFSPSISLPIFTGGYNTSQLNYTKAQKEYYIAAYEKSVQTAFQEVADALARRGTIHEQLDEQKNYAKASEEYYRLAELRYRNGVDSWLNALDAQRTLYSARTSLVSVQQEYYTNLITLYKVMGGGTALQEKTADLQR
ncbi:efflux transporter outer membrane subunit [Klebsiella oxytoca]|uniref:efflux transporter outer membrane subunit n=1 Tax=Klebsiella oxytoca TaxID=571 RepID=UPI0035711EE7|nr:efflux transporter outer membrane subunit [Klebsiella oxytoca]HBW1604211.1 efflux transporter outer membrane subunit [Klebsiella pneumoniae]HCB2157575.1 efflux transporter outer membrane subunit [Klebsiella oxytoca]HDQ3433281.1 efflux transporter outer membrane subunit [Klebsiella pneumoniae]